MADGLPELEHLHHLPQRPANALRSRGIARPELATEAQLIAWATAAPANNTIRKRIATALAFFDWCAEQGHPTPDLRRLRKLKRSYPKTYGKVEAKNPARWLTKEEAYGLLIDVCRVDPRRVIGLRDELVIRFGLAGMRRAQIATLTWRNVAALPAVTWKGKHNRPRKVKAGPGLMAAIAEWLARYPNPGPTPRSSASPRAVVTSA